MIHRLAVILAMTSTYALAAPSHAAPSLTVAHLGLNGAGNREWTVALAPDPTLFAMTSQGFGGVLSTELALEIIGAELASVSRNAVHWPHDTPGLNPFSGSPATGLLVDLANDRAFAALTSEFLTSGQSIAMLHVETLGAGAAQFRWGGHDLLVGTPFSYTGSRISQAATNFDGYAGVLAVPTASADFDDDGVVDGSDFLIWQRGLRGDGAAVRRGGDADSDGHVDGVDLNVWQASYGLPAFVPTGAAGPLTVPEPSTTVIVLVGCLVRWLFRRGQPPLA